MKTRLNGVLGTASLAGAACMFVASGASADNLGWTSSVRSVSATGAITNGFVAGSSSYLINVFAVTNNSTDTFFSVSGAGGNRFVTTNSAGGFQQGTGKQNVWAPFVSPTSASPGSQSWTTLDSFLTAGGGQNSTTGAFSALGSTTADPDWTVSYTDIDGNPATANAFQTPSDPDVNFVNPYINIVAPTGGWYFAPPPGTTAGQAARSLAVLGTARQGFQTANGINYGSSSQQAADAQFGWLVAQLHVTQWGGFGAAGKYVDWKMLGAVKTATGGSSNVESYIRIGEVPAPGALALLGLAGAASARRRRQA